MGHLLVRLAIFGLGLLMVLGGFAGIAVGGPSAAAGLWGVIVGLVLILAVALERNRYRSEAADATASAIGPGGGEPLADEIEPRFRPTAERFVDPTTRHRMRVYVDASTGERRYRAED